MDFLSRWLLKYCSSASETRADNMAPMTPFLHGDDTDRLRERNKLNFDMDAVGLCYIKLYVYYIYISYVL